MTAEQGLNLAGVETVLELEARLEEMRAELRAMRERTAEMEQRMSDEIERDRRSLGAELVPYGAYEPTLAGGRPRCGSRSSAETPPRADQVRRLNHRAGGPPPLRSSRSRTSSRGLRR